MNGSTDPTFEPRVGNGSSLHAMREKLSGGAGRARPNFYGNRTIKLAVCVTDENAFGAES